MSEKQLLPFVVTAKKGWYPKEIPGKQLLHLSSNCKGWWYIFFSSKSHLLLIMSCSNCKPPCSKFHLDVLTKQIVKKVTWNRRNRRKFLGDDTLFFTIFYGFHEALDGSTSYFKPNSIMIRLSKHNFYFFFLWVWRSRMGTF